MENEKIVAKAPQIASYSHDTYLEVKVEEVEVVCAPGAGDSLVVSQILSNDLKNSLFSYAEIPSSTSVASTSQDPSHDDNSPARNWKRQYYQQKKPRECQYCHKVFIATPGNFKKHYYTHFPKNSFKCDYCNYSTALKHSFMRHSLKCKGPGQSSMNYGEVPTENELDIE